MAIEIQDSDYQVKVPYGFKGEKITIAELIKSKEVKSLNPLFAENIINLIRDNPSIGILKGGAGRSEEQVNALFYQNYKKIKNAPDYENDPQKYDQIKNGALKYNSEDSSWYRRVGKTVATPGSSWHTGGYAVDFTGDIALAGKVGKKYQLEQILGTGETHHFQPLGVPISKRMFLELKNVYGIDAIATPLSPDILSFINKEIASNVPRHPQRIKKVLDAAIAKFKIDTGTSDDVAASSSVMTEDGRASTKTTIAWDKVVKVSPTTVAKALATTTTTAVPRSTTTTSRPTTTTSRPSTTTSTMPKSTTTSTTSPPRKSPQPLAPLSPSRPMPTTTTTVPKVVSYDPKTGVPLDSKGNVIPVTVPPNAVMPTTTSTTVPRSTSTTVPAKPATPEVPVTPVTPADPVTPVVADGRTPKDYGNKKPAKAIEGDTYTNSKNVKFTFKGGKYVRTATLTASVAAPNETESQQWKETVQKEFGPLWDVYNEDPEVKKEIDKSVKEGYFNDPVKLSAALSKTNWFRTTQESARQYILRESTDPATLKSEVDSALETIRASALQSGFTLSESSLTRLAQDKVKYKWGTQQTSNSIGSEAVLQASAGGGQGVTDLRRGSIGTNLREIADNYIQKPTNTMLDSFIADILQGKKTEQQFTDLMKSSASAQYRSLAPMIEKGQDVKTAVSMYTNTAQKILGVDTNTVDWTDSKWNQALNYQDPKTKEYRQMDSYEWSRYLRSLPEWQETDDAKDRYRSAAFTLAQAFGKTT